MPLKLMFITKSPEIAQIAENAGVDRIFIDLEYIGKNLRQGGMDTVQNHHTFADIKNIRNAIQKAEIMVRINPIHPQTEDYCNSQTEIEEVINAGADLIMLPYFKTPNEVALFLKMVNHRKKTILLFETPESIQHIDEILKIDGIDEVFIGLNDLSLGYGYKFMFELLGNGTVDKIVSKFTKKNLHFGFGGIAAPGKGALPSEKIIAEHYRLGSECVILSRSFCNTEIITDLNEIDTIFKNGMLDIRKYETFCSKQSKDFFLKNHLEVSNITANINNS